MYAVGPLTNAYEIAAVRGEFVRPGQTLPLVIRTCSGVRGTEWLRENRAMIEERLGEHGAVLFRGFPVDSAESFNAFANAAAGELLEYKERSSPRHEQGDRIYTSTDYPPEYRIYLHNEHSYARRFPMKLLFCCLIPARQGGQTPLADTRRILARISAETRRKFTEKKWMYVRNFGAGFGLSWQTAFQTSSAAEVESYCASAGIECEWKADGGLRTRQVRPAVFAHPRTGEQVWFNHATFFHLSTLPPIISEMLQSNFAEEDLPNNTYYGDGSPIEAETLEELRGAYEAETFSFNWQRGDVLLVDNMLAAHARESYQGPRRVLVAMAESYEPADS